MASSIFPLFFSNQVFAKIPVHLFIGLSGGYGQNSDAYENTGTDGAIRFAFGSILPINSSFVIGDQIAFQTGSQIRLNNQLTTPIGSGIVPVLLNTKTPIISSLDVTQGTFQLKGIPVWRGALLTFEHDL